MHAKDAILSSLGMAETVTKQYLKDLSPADLLVRPVAGQNHIAWQLGHLLQSERHFAEFVRPGMSPELPENFAEGHGRDKSKVDDPSLFLSAEEYVALYDTQRAATKKILEELTDAELDEPGPESVKDFAPTKGATMMLIGSHELMHVGQYVAVRRLLDKPVTI